MAILAKINAAIAFGKLTSAGSFTPSGTVLGPSDIASIKYSQTIGESGRLAVGVAEASQCEVSVLSSSLPSGWGDLWQSVTISQTETATGTVLLFAQDAAVEAGGDGWLRARFVALSGTEELPSAKSYLWQFSPPDEGGNWFQLDDITSDPVCRYDMTGMEGSYLRVIATLEDGTEVTSANTMEAWYYTGTPGGEDYEEFGGNTDEETLEKLRTVTTDTVLGVFKPDLSTVKDDRLFTSFTAYDQLYFVDADFDTSVYDNYDVDGSYSMTVMTLAEEVYSQLQSNGVSLSVDENVVAAMESSYLGIFRPCGTLREVLSYLCLILGCNVVNVAGYPTLRWAGSQRRVARSEYAAGSLDTCGGWTSKLMAAVFDIDTSVAVGSSTMAFDMVVPANISGTLKKNGGYILEPDCGGLVWDGMGVVSTVTQSTLENLVNGDTTTVARNAGSCLTALSDLTSTDGSTIERAFATEGYDGASVDVEGSIILPGDIVLAQDPLNDTLWAFPVVSTTITYDGSLTSSVSADSASYDSDSYSVSSSGEVTRTASSSSTNTSSLRSDVSSLGSTVNSLSSAVASTNNWNIYVSNNNLYIEKVSS